MDIRTFTTEEIEVVKKRIFRGIFKKLKEQRNEHKRKISTPSRKTK